MEYLKLNQQMVILILGGEDFDLQIINYLADEFKKDNSVDLDQINLHFKD